MAQYDLAARTVNYAGMEKVGNNPPRQTPDGHYTIGVEADALVIRMKVSTGVPVPSTPDQIAADIVRCVSAA